MERWITIWAIILVPVFSTAADNNKNRAIEIFKEATVLFKSEEYKAAAEKFKECYELKPTYKILYNIGQSEAAAKRYGISLQAFQRYLANGGDDIPKSRQEYVRTEIERLRYMIGFLEVTAPQDSQIIIDGVQRGNYPTVKRIPVAATVVHEVRAKKEDGSETPTMRISVTGGDSVSVELLIEEEKKAFLVEPSDTDIIGNSESSQAPSDAPGTKRKKPFISGLVVGGMGLAGVIGGSVFGGLSLLKDNLVRKRCPNGTCDPRYHDLVDTRDRYVLLSTILWAAGGALTATGIVMILVAKLKDDESEDSSIAVIPGIGGLVLAGEF